MSFVNTEKNPNAVIKSHEDNNNFITQKSDYTLGVLNLKGLLPLPDRDGLKETLLVALCWLNQFWSVLHECSNPTRLY